MMTYSDTFYYFQTNYPRGDLIQLKVHPAIFKMSKNTQRLLAYEDLMITTNANFSLVNTASEIEG